MRKINKTFFLFLALFTVALKSMAQPVPTLRQQMSTITTYNGKHMPEKLFIHTDKCNYNKEDTLWFKAYVFDATMVATNKSGLMYIEIANDQNRVVTRNMVELSNGIGWGAIVLTDARYTEGTYTLRAYTNWMRNFDERYVYTRQFTVDGPLDEDWMINSRFELIDQEGSSNIKTNLQMVKNGGSRMFAEELKMRITAGKRTLYNTRLTTGPDGTLDFNFNLPEKVSAQEINIALTKKTKRGKDVTFNVPVVINRDEKTDVQFMPEGGSLINDILSKVAFKAVNEEGKGVDLSGGIYTGTGNKIVDLVSVHNGMGYFTLLPRQGETYVAKVNFHGKQLSFPLPAAKVSGMVMGIDNLTNKDSIIITVSPSADNQQKQGRFYLIGQSRSVVCYGAAVNAANGSKRLSVQRAAFPTGIVRFTLLNTLNQPVAERIVYVNHYDDIKLSITPSKAVYAERDSVTLDITATDKEGLAVTGSFSLAVTDDAQVKPDAASCFDISLKTLLASDLKGEVENPEWYFTKGDSTAKAAALDALLLTQGWVSYNWTDVFSAERTKLLYEAEPDFLIKGKVVNAFSKPIEKSNVSLFSTKPLVVADTITNAQGEFTFTKLPHYDTVAYNLQAKNKRGRMFNVGIELNEFTPPAFNIPVGRLIPFYVNIDTSRLEAIRARQVYKEEKAKLTGTQLNEVQIKAKKGVKDSKTLLEPGEADFTLNEENMQNAGKANLLNVLEKNVKGFSSVGSKGLNYYNIHRVFTVFIIDGIFTIRFVPQGFGYYNYMKGVLEYIDAEDVRGIEVMQFGKGQMTYWSEYISSIAPMSKPSDFTFIEVTTYSGNGLFMKKTPGQYLYRPPIFASTKEFYSPKYAVKTPVVVPDTRPTIFWVPNIVTDLSGKASVRFYTADKASTYTVNIQGADMKGAVGAHQSKISIKQGL